MADKSRYTMSDMAVFRRGALTKSVNDDRVATFSLRDLRVMALDPGLFAACCDYARSFYPRTDLARAA